MQVEIFTPDAKLFEGEAEGIKLPGELGLFEVLKGHAPIISSLMQGQVRVRADGKDETFEINNGFVEVLNDQVSVIVELKKGSKDTASKD